MRHYPTIASFITFYFVIPISGQTTPPQENSNSSWIDTAIRFLNTPLIMIISVLGLIALLALIPAGDNRYGLAGVMFGAILGFVFGFIKESRNTLLVTLFIILFGSIFVAFTVGIINDAAPLPTTWTSAYYVTRFITGNIREGYVILFNGILNLINTFLPNGGSP